MQADRSELEAFEMWIWRRMEKIGLYRILALALANPGSKHVSEIQPSPVPSKFLNQIGGCQRSCSTFSQLQIKLNTADL